MNTPYPPQPSLEVPDARHDQPYDAAMRHWAEHNLAALAAWLDPSTAGLPAPSFERQPTAFTVPTLHADLLIRIGPNRLMHVEYETRPGKDLALRMYRYRGQIMNQYPGVHLTQHIIVLGDGRVTGYDDLANGFILDLRVTHLHDEDPTRFLTDPVLAPLAVLTRGTREQRERYFATAVRLILDSGHPWTSELLLTAETLAHIRLDPPTINRIGKEHGMSIGPLVDFWRDTEVGHHLQNIGREVGREEGREEGLLTGQAEEKEKMLLALLYRRFGDRSETAPILRHLANWSETDALNAILDAPNLASLLTAEPPT